MDFEEWLALGYVKTGKCTLSGWDSSIKWQSWGGQRFV